MNRNQRLFVIGALIFIGLVLAFLILEWSEGGFGRTRLMVFYERHDPAYPRTPDQIGVYTRYGGVAGALLGIIAPLCLFAVAAFIALGTNWRR